MGISYSLLAASLWPCLAYLVPERSLGTAYGVMQSIQNFGLALLFLSVGPIIEARGYIALEIYFLAFLCGKLKTKIANIVSYCTASFSFYRGSNPAHICGFR